MKIVVPNYYKEFQCIASACRHSCCIGWEIDIDSATYSYYGSIGGDIGERLKECTAVNDGQAHFILDKNERCPFLNCNGLCDIITECGEESLCDICADHPRFRNFFSDRTEIGLGLCCEAAAKLILGFDRPFRLEVIEDDGEQVELYEDEITFAKDFENAISVAQDKSISFSDRCEKILKMFSASLPDYSPLEWADFYSSLERLDSEWDKCLEYLCGCQQLETDSVDEQKAENLLCYFLFRHMAYALDDGDVASKVGFAVLSCKVILTLARLIGVEEAARKYSSEIEYSDENIGEILKLF